MPFTSDSDRTPPEMTPLWQSIVKRVPQPLVFRFDALPADSIWGREMRLDGARFDLAEARAALAAAVKAQDPDRHFRGLPESAEVIAAYDAVRAAEAEVARLERDGRTP